MRLLVISALAAMLATVALEARGQAQLGLAGTRTHYTTDEPIELAIAAPADQEVQVILQAEGKAPVTLTVPPGGAGGAGGGARLVTVQPRVLAAGQYTARLANQEQAAVEFTVHWAEHPNPYFTGQWVHHGGTADNATAKAGWMHFNTDYISMHSRPPQAGDIAEAYIAAGARPNALMILGGGHQLDLDLVNDWGDPWVQRAIIWRGQLAALTNRIYPIMGLHTFDEPGLTWWPITDEQGERIGMHPFIIPHQLEEYQQLTGVQMPVGTMAETFPQYAGMMEDWIGFFDMRMKYLQQAWSANVWATESVHPAFGTLNQVSSSYAAGGAIDGVDGRQGIPYAVVSGHGGYADLPFGTMQPLRSAEGMQPTTRDREHVYLPMWYTHTWQTMRANVWPSWTTKLEGMLYTPEQEFGFEFERNGYHGSNTIFEIAEINRNIARVGGVIYALPKTPAPVAVLCSHIQQAVDIAEANRPGAGAEDPTFSSRHLDQVNLTFFRVIETGMIPNWLDEHEAVTLGADFLSQWEVIFLPGLSHAAPEFRQVLEQYVANGGTLVQNEGDGLIIEGAVVAGHGFGETSAYWREHLDQEARPYPHRVARNQDLEWREWNLSFAPTFKEDLRGWLGELPYDAEDDDLIIGVHKLGNATYLLMANHKQIRSPRGWKHEFAPMSTRVTLPAEGVVYDLFNGGQVEVTDGAAALELGIADGALWVHLPGEVGEPELTAEAEDTNELEVRVQWGEGAALPFRLRLTDPAGQEVLDLYRATVPQADGEAAVFTAVYPLGQNATPGTWTVQVTEWLTGSTQTAEVDIQPGEGGALASANDDRVSIYFDDAQRIADLFAGEAQQPPYEKMNHESEAVFGLDATRFAVFGPEQAANRIAEALRGKGMNVEVNPAYEIVPFERRPNRGGAGPRFRLENFENIYAHAVVLPGHELGERAWTRGHINRPVTETFPGPGRAYVQWAGSAHQAGFEQVFVFGDAEAGVDYLLRTIEGGAVEPAESAVQAAVGEAPAPGAGAAPATLEAAATIRTPETPVGVASSPDGDTIYAALYDGSVVAYGPDGAEQWKTRPLSEATALALSPAGDKLAVVGYPGVKVLNAANGDEVGEGVEIAPAPSSQTGDRYIAVAWNDAGTLVAAGGLTNRQLPADLEHAPVEVVILDADGNVRSRPEGIAGDVFGVAFVPGGDTLLVGADRLVAINAQEGASLWNADVAKVSRFAFSADGTSVAVGGWGKSAGLVNLQDGAVSSNAQFPSVVGGVALTPDNRVVVAVWGGVKPLYVLGQGENGEAQASPLFQSRFAFQDVTWSAARNALVASEQGGRVWVLSPQGEPQGKLDDGGSTVYHLEETDGALLLGRMNRVVQRVER